MLDDVNGLGFLALGFWVADLNLAVTGSDTACKGVLRLGRIPQASWSVHKALDGFLRELCRVHTTSDKLCARLVYDVERFTIFAQSFFFRTT